VDIQGKAALVTGGAVRVGRALVLGLAEAGADVIVHYHRSETAATATVAQARQQGVRAEAVQADLADPVAARSASAAALECFGRVDILVHSASPFVRASLPAVKLAEWRQVMGVVVEGFLVLAQGLGPGMVEQGEGAIVAILDRGVVDPWPEYLAHSAAKSALWALARSLAVELAPHVRVNGIVPGPILAPPGLSDDKARHIADGTLLGRWGGPQGVVDALLFLLRTDFVTGEIVFVDGGERWAHRRQIAR
jgi:NAD(P)-dependent dehydrogenase (short-subunit alcohol dehydrogenase family)